MTIDSRLEIYYDSTWNDISVDADTISIDYGQPDEHGESIPTDIRFVLDNGRRYAPKDPRSELYRKVGIGTPIRVRIGDRQQTLALPGANGSYASTPDAPALGITGDIDIRVQLTPDTWNPDDLRIIAGKYQAAGDQRSWALRIKANGYMDFAWTTSGASGTRKVAASTVPVPANTTAVAVTLDVNNGASGYDVKFYTATSISASWPWTQLGATVTGSGTTSIYDGTADLTIGSLHGGDGEFSNDGFITAAVSAFQLRNGINGTLVADIDFTTPDVRSTTITDDTSLVWTLHESATLDDISILGSSFASRWDPRWDQTTIDARMAVESSGIRSQLTKGKEPLNSSLYRDLSTKTNVVAYWPFEGGRESDQLEGLFNAEPAFVAGDVSLAANSDLPASDALPTLSAGRIVGRVNAYTPDINQRVVTYIDVPSDGVADEETILAIDTTGTMKFWGVRIDELGRLRLVAHADTGGFLVDTGTVVFNLNGKKGFLWLWLSQDGTAIDWQFGFLEVGQAVGSVVDGTLASHTYSRVDLVRLGGVAGVSLNGTGVGHAFIMNGDVDSGFWATAQSSLVAWTGEKAGSRVRRLATEENVPLAVIGDPDDTVPLGPQRITTLMDQFRDAALSEMAVYGEHRSKPMLRWRTRFDRYKQALALELDMASGHITNPFDPPLDNSDVVNDLTVTRDGGSKYRVQKTEGPLNVNGRDEDPDGIGRHPGSPGSDLSLASDGQLPDQATWRLHLGTVDEHRIATLEIEMEHHPELQQGVLEMQQGDLIRLINPPAGLPPDDLDLIVLGWKHIITGTTWKLVLNCAPGSPWRIWVLEGDEYSRLSPVHAELADDFTSGTDTSLKVANGRWEGFEHADQLVEHTDAGDAGWSRTNATANSGTWSLKAGTISDDETSDAVITVPAHATHVQFAYRVSSEEDFDLFEFLIDGQVLLEVSGEVGWTTSSRFAVQPDQTLTFRYSKDGSASAGSDTAWIDDLSFTISELWETNSALTDPPFDIMAAGVRLSVTAISGSSSPQTMTVDQTPVNGVEKTIPRGTPVELAHPAIVGL